MKVSDIHVINVSIKQRTDVMEENRKTNNNDATDTEDFKNQDFNEDKMLLAMKTKLALKKIMKRKKQFSPFLYQYISFPLTMGTQVSPWHTKLLKEI